MVGKYDFSHLCFTQKSKRGLSPLLDVSVGAAESRNPQYGCVGCADISLVLEGA